MFTEVNLYVSKYAVLTAEELHTFNAILQPKNIAKKTMLLRQGEICNFEAYINKGCLRTYYLDENGHEVTLQFATEGWWVSDIASFHEQKPSHLFIEAMEDCELLTLSPATKDRLLAEVPKFERIFRIMVQRNLSRLQNRFFKSIYATAEEKYLEFLEHYPTIPQRVAQHYIASYLGISAEFLSKVRTKLTKK
jgi:CRP/FNR family cyclic AMP-dependent transcriptional regulator